MKNTSLALVLCLAGCAHAHDVDALQLFRALTLGRTQLDPRLGEPRQLDDSEKRCAAASCSSGETECTTSAEPVQSPLLRASDVTQYYGLRPGPDDFVRYNEDSSYGQDIRAVVHDMDGLLDAFEATGLRATLAQQQRTPALMFDIDNTLEFTAGPDTDLTGTGPQIRAMVEFVRRRCFKQGLDCYFITARTCEPTRAAATASWVKTNLELTDEQIRRYTFLSRNPEKLTCAATPTGVTVAYKDVLREALEQQRKVFWLMSIGDQLTDSLGEHSGVKVRLPNQFFHSDVVPNQYASYGAGSCARTTTIAPPRACAETLTAHALSVTTVEYCSNQQPAAH